MYPRLVELGQRALAFIDYMLGGGTARPSACEYRRPARFTYYRSRSRGGH